MEIETCEDLLRGVNMTLTEEIIHVILPRLCDIVDYPNATYEEKEFHTFCCSPIPTMVMNKMVHLTSNLTDSSKLVEDICSYITFANNSDYDETYNDLCVPKQQPQYVNKSLFVNYQLLSYIVLALGFPLGFFANILILLTIYKVKRLRNTTGYFICNLAIADLLVIIQMLLFQTLYRTDIMHNADARVKRFIFPSLDVFLGSASLLHVTAVSIERGVAVSMPLNYPRYLSERRSKRIIQFIWLYCLLMFVYSISRIWIKSMLYENIFLYTVISISFFIPCILVTISYTFIMFSALKNIRMERKISKVVVVISMMDDQNLEKITSRPARYREVKIAFNVAIITVPFIFGWGYFMICNIYETVAQKNLTGFQNFLITYLPFFVSCINPLTYLMFTRTLRKSSWYIVLKSLLFFNFKKPFLRRESVFTSVSWVSNEKQTLSATSNDEVKPLQCGEPSPPIGTTVRVSFEDPSTDSAEEAKML